MPTTSAPAAPATPASPAVSVNSRPPFSVWAFMAASWLLGGWMVYDGLHQRLWGDYVRLDGQLGPWAALVSGLGFDPQQLGTTFVGVGLALVGASLAVWQRRPWGHKAALALSAGCLLYLGFGTPVALLCLVLLLLPTTRAYSARAG